MNIEENLKQLNQVRRKTENKLAIFYTIMIIMALPILAIVAPQVIMIENGVIFIIAILVIDGLLIRGGHKIIIKNYRSVFKMTVVPEAIKQFGEDVSYQQSGFTRDEAIKTNMFGNISKFSSEDTVKGSISSVNFRCSDVKMGYYRRTGKHRRYVPVCHGQLYIFDFNKRFKTRTIIREEKPFRPSGLSKVKLENVEFNQKFHIFSNNQHDAFYILTPHFMEKLLYLERKHPGTIYMAFYHNQLHIGIHNNKDRFEPPLFESIQKSIFDSQLNDLILIKEIIEDLKLNIKIFVD